MVVDSLRSLDAQSFTGDPIKMTATNTNGHSPTVTVLPQTKYLVSLMTVIRDAQTGCPAFVDAFEKVCTQLMPAGTVTHARLYPTIHILTVFG
jgi:hypothetical protein